MKRILFFSATLCALLSLCSCRGSAGKAAGVRLIQVLAEASNDVSDDSESGNINFKGKSTPRPYNNNNPCNICDKCGGYSGWYNGYYTKCACGHTFGAH